MMKEYKAIGFTEQNDSGKWTASLIHRHGALESWNHETRTEAERMITHLGAKLGLRRVGDWRRQ